MLLYRRHLKTCRHRKKGQNFAGCKCPIWIDGALNGKRYRRALETCDWEKAERKKAGLESTGEDKTSKTVADALAAWDRSLGVQALRESTIRKYRRLKQRFSTWCEDKGYILLNQITTEVIDAFRTERPKIQASTSAKELEILRGIFSFCMDRGWSHDNPARRIKTPKVRPKEKLPYTPQEMVAILSACDLIGQEAYERQRARAMILVMRHTGLRVGDSFLLRKDHIREGRVFLHAKKNSQPVFLPIPVELQRALESLPLPFGSDRDSGYFFWNGKGDPESALTRVEKALHSVYAKVWRAGCPLSQVPPHGSNGSPGAWRQPGNSGRHSRDQRPRCRKALHQVVSATAGKGVGDHERASKTAGRTGEIWYTVGTRGIWAG